MSREALDYVAKYAHSHGIKGAKLQIMWILAYKSKDRRAPFRSQASALEISVMMTMDARHIQRQIAELIEEEKLNIGHPGVGRAPTSYWFGHRKDSVVTVPTPAQATVSRPYLRKASTGSA